MLGKLVNAEYVTHLKSNSKRIIRGEKVFLFMNEIEEKSHRVNNFSIIKKYIYKMLNFKDAIL